MATKRPAEGQPAKELSPLSSPAGAAAQAPQRDVHARDDLIVFVATDVEGKLEDMRSQVVNQLLSLRGELDKVKAGVRLNTSKISDTSTPDVHVVVIVAKCVLLSPRS